MEPVKIKAPAPQLDVPSSQHEDAEESDATEHEFHESVKVVEVKAEPEKGGRRRRRASSSGVITPGA
jgi:ribonuclease E